MMVYTYCFTHALQYILYNPRSDDKISQGMCQLISKLISFPEIFALLLSNRACFPPVVRLVRSAQTLEFIKSDKHEIHDWHS